MIIDLEGCFSDSPSFKMQLQSVELYLHNLEHHLKGLCKAAKASIQAMNELSLCNNQLARSLIDLGSLEVSSEGVVRKNQGNDIICIGSELAAIEEQRKEMAWSIERVFISPIETLLKGDLQMLKELKKRYEKSHEEYYHASGKYMGKKSKEDALFEAAQEVADCRKEFHECSLDYCLKLDEVLQKKSFLVTSAVSTMALELGSFYAAEAEAMGTVDKRIGDIQMEAKVQREGFETEMNKLYDAKNRILKRSLTLYNPLIIDRTPTPLPQSGEKEGYLYKKSTHTVRPLWSRRYFELKGDGLQYWRGNGEQSVVNIDLRLCSVRPCENGERRFCFELLSPVRSYCLQAENEHEMHMWMETIQHAIGRNLSNSNLNNVSLPSYIERALTEEEREVIMQTEGNEECADCGTKRPEWALINFGALVCIECSGLHRARGVHKSKVKSLCLDHFTQEQIGILMKLGNGKVKSLLCDSKDIEEKYSQVVVKKDSDDEMVKLLGDLINGKQDAPIEEMILNAQYEMVTLCFLWGYPVKFNYLRELLLSKDPAALSLLLHMLKRSPNLSHEEREELEDLAKSHEFGVVEELLMEEASDDDNNNNNNMSEHGSPSKSKRKALKEGLKHQLSKITQ